MNQFLLSFILLFLLSIMCKAESRINITANGETYEILLADSEAARLLADRIKGSPITVNLSDYGGFEKVGSLPWSLPTNNRQITTSPGDVMLYQGDNIVIFYGSNSWAYTPLGKLEGLSTEEIRNFLKGSQVTATLSSYMETGLNEIDMESSTSLEIYTMQGVKIDMKGKNISMLPKGIYIINGYKHIIK